MHLLFQRSYANVKGSFIYNEINIFFKQSSFYINIFTDYFTVLKHEKSTLRHVADLKCKAYGVCLQISYAN